jgi:heavy metal translocating P-type ATPase
MMTETIAIPRHPHTKPVVFEEYFGLGEEESASPFLTPSSRKWAIHLSLKASLLAAFLLFIALVLSFSSVFLPLSNLTLVAVYFLAGIPSLIEAIEDLIDLDVNIDVLMTLAAFSSFLIGSGLEGGLLLVLFSLSGSIEDAVTAKAKGSINQLHKLSPSKACVIEPNGHLIERSVKDIEIGTWILVKSGEVVPLDGKVMEGISSVNFVHLTGESLPILKQKGDELPAGARNLEGTFTLEVTRTSADSTLSRIIQLVMQAHEAKPKLQRWFDRFSRNYAISIISLATFFALTFPFLLGIPFLGIEGSVYRALTFLIAASPCALILALPIAYLSAVSACARNGILLKGGVTLEALAQCSIIAFDKTGTLTTGQLAYDGFEALGNNPWSQEDVLSIAYALERNTVHPIAKAITTYANENKISPCPIRDFKAIPGYGVEATAVFAQQTFPVFMGHPAYLLNRLSDSLKEELDLKIQHFYESGKLLAILSIDSVVYLFTFQDSLRENLKETIQRLKENWKLIMLTGDHEYSAKSVAEQLGIPEFHANLRPEHKLDHVTRLAQEKGLAMVGDGINDAPALARATVGICMGKVGSGTAIDAADVVLLQDNLERLDWLMNKAKQTQSIVRQNLIIASLAILIAAFPALAGMVPLWLAVVMHEGGTVLVGLNALRLLK